MASRRAVMFGVPIAVLFVVAGAWLWTPDQPRAALEAEYAAPPSTFMAVDGVRVHVRDTGPRDAPAIVLLHGFGSSLHTWDAWAGLLEGDRRVIRYDQPGFGLTGGDPSGDYSDARSVKILADLLDALGVQKADVVGNSMGGRIAWRFAAAYPQRTRKLVLMAPDGFASPGLAYGKPPSVPLAMKILPYVMPTPMLRMSLKPAYGDPAVMTDALVRRYRDMMLAPGVRRAILDRMPQTILVDPVPLLAKITAPTLLLWGQQDGMVPFGNSADYARDIHDVRLVSFPGRGHLLMEEIPAQSVAAVKAFLGAP